MTCSFYSNKVLFAEDLTCHFLNKHLWQNTPFSSKIIAPTTGQCRKLLYNAFNSHVKAVVDILYACLLPNIKHTFANVVISDKVSLSFFTTMAMLLREDYFSTLRVDVGNFLHYCVILATLSAYFYEWGCKEAPERAVEFISSVFPDYASFQPFCSCLHKACQNFLQKERTLLARLLQDTAYSSGVPFNYYSKAGIKCSCFEYEETGRTFDMAFKNRYIALKKHALFCGVSTSSYKLGKLRSFDVGELKGCSILAWNFKCSSILRRATLLSEHSKDDTIPFKDATNQGNISQEKQKSFAFPSCPFLNRNKHYESPCTSSRDALRGNSELGTDAELKNTSLDTNKENIHANNSSVWKEPSETEEIFYKSVKEFLTGLKTVKKAECTESVDTDYSKMEISDSASDADQNRLSKPVIKQTRKKMTRSQNGMRLSYFSTFVSQTVTKSSESRELTFLQDILLGSISYIQGTFNKGLANKVGKFVVDLECLKTIGNLNESEEESDGSIKKKRRLTLIKSEVLGDPCSFLKLLDQLRGQKLKGVANRATKVN